MNGEEIIIVEHLTKVFSGKKPVTAVDDISLRVNKGEIFGLLGPNGAGKSTLIRILTTLLVPTSGRAVVGSFDVTTRPEEIRRIIGVCPQNSTLDLELTAYDNLDFYGKLTDVPEERLPRRISELLAMTGLADRAHVPVSTFSGGMKRKLEIVRAFIHQPLILFLDEPTIGLDPESRREVWNQILSLNNEETTIILTTHYMDEADTLCSRVAFVDNGSLIALDSPVNLKHSLSIGDLIEIGVEDPDTRLTASIRDISGVHAVEQKGNRIIVSTHDGSRILPDLLARFEIAGVSMTSISIRTPSLEDVFISLTGRNLTTGGTGPDTGHSGRSAG